MLVGLPDHGLTTCLIDRPKLEVLPAIAGATATSRASRLMPARPAPPGRDRASSRLGRRCSQFDANDAAGHRGFRPPRPGGPLTLLPTIDRRFPFCQLG